MKENRFSPKMAEKSDELLMYYIKNKDQFSDDQVLAAQWEMEKRGMTEVLTEVAATEQQELVEPSEFPPKPEEENKQQSINRSLISIGLFVAAFNLILQKKPILDLGFGGKILFTAIWLLTFALSAVVLAL